MSRHNKSTRCYLNVNRWKNFDYRGVNINTENNTHGKIKLRMNAVDQKLLRNRNNNHLNYCQNEQKRG